MCVCVRVKEIIREITVAREIKKKTTKDKIEQCHGTILN